MFMTVIVMFMSQLYNRTWTIFEEKTLFITETVIFSWLMVTKDSDVTFLVGIDRGFCFPADVSENVEV